MDFQLLFDVYVDDFKVPLSKQDIFLSNIDLIQKRKLMKTISSIEPTLDDFGTFLKTQLDADLSRIVLDGILFSETLSKKKAAEKIQKFLKSSGKFGNSPYLLGMYGSGSEMCQALCRTAAVYGATYMLNVKFEIKKEKEWIVQVGEKCFKTPLLVAHGSFFKQEVSSKKQQCAIYISQKPIKSNLCALVNKNNVFFLQQTSELRICPKDVYVIHARGKSKQEIIEAAKELIPDPLQVMFFEQTQNIYKSNDSSLLLTNDPHLGLDYDDDFDDAMIQLEEFMGEKIVFEPLPDPEA